MKNLFLVPALAVGLLFMSCKGNEPTPTPNGGKYDDYPYSALTPEQQKEKLAAESDAILQKLDGLQNAKAIDLFLSLNACMSRDEEPSYPEPGIDDPYYPTFYTSKQFRSSFWEEDKVMIKDVYGTFTWDFDEEDWTYTETPTDKLLVILPESTESTANNGKIEISGTGSGQIVKDGDEQYEIPKAIKAVMWVGSEQVSSIELSAENVSWSDNNTDWSNVASSANASVKIDSYTFAAGASQEPGSKINSTFSFAKGSDAIFKGSIAGTIDWNYEEEYCTWSEWDTETKTYICKEYETTTSVIPEGMSAELEIGSNLAIEARVDVKALTEALDAIDDKYSYNSNTVQTEAMEREEAAEEAAAYNKYVYAVLVSRADKSKIATLKWGVDSEERSYMMCSENGACEEVKYNDYYSAAFLVFNDKTEITADTYFGSGFDKVIDAWEDFLSGFDFE